MFLALEATDRGGSVALGSKERLLGLVYEDSDLTHSERLMPAVDRLLDEHDCDYSSIDRVAVARGPGSFTAIRLAVTTAKTLSMVCGADLVAPTTLRVMAEYGTGRNCLVTTVIDARRGEVYYQQFRRESGSLKAEDSPALAAPGELNLREGLAVFRGRDLDWEDVDPSGVLTRVPESTTRPLAAPLIDIARDAEPVADPDLVAPCYVRKSDAQRSANGGG